MLEIKNANLTLGDAETGAKALDDTNLAYPRSHFGAILGPSGCGKSTLLKVIAGLLEPDDGALLWDGRNLAEEEDIDPADLGYVPQFGIVHETLTLRESLAYCLKLRVAGISNQERQERIDEALGQVGLLEIGDRQGRRLSGGQKRRQALALEIVSKPSLLLADEVTSGLDPKAEEEIVGLLRQLANTGLLVLSITHSLKHLEVYDSVTVLNVGAVVYSGVPQGVLKFFDVTDPDAIFKRLDQKPVDYWKGRWDRYKHLFVEGGDEQPMEPGEDPMTAFISRPHMSAEELEAEARYLPGKKTERAVEETSELKSEVVEPPYDDSHPRALHERDASEARIPSPRTRVHRGSADTGRPMPRHRVPDALSQFWTLLLRRFHLFFRDPGQVYLQISLLILFPGLVIPFAMNGLPQIRNMALSNEVDIIEQAEEAVRFAQQTSEVGGLVSGLIMFQVILVTLMGSNNGAREVVNERTILEKEKLSGLRPLAYLASKVAFLSCLVLVQSLWMTIVVKFVCGFPGSLLDQAAMLVLANAGLTAICLAISCWSNSGEQSSLISIYFVGFQLPLSGAVLALPDPLGNITRPIISAYWSWSGYLQTMSDTRFYDSADAISQTPISSLDVCYWILLWHVSLGIFVAYLGVARSRW